MDVTPVTLVGKRVRLEPLHIDHVDDLWAAGNHECLWCYMGTRVSNIDEMRQWVETALQWQAAGTCMPWVTRCADDNRVIGSTRFANIVQQHRVLEIGWTWLTPQMQRTRRNPEAKLLQLTHAFEVMGARRVELKTHHLNLHSQQAMRAMGATEEGTFRNHMIGPDGSTRNSVWFSVIAEEWPAVKARLQQRA